jgi:hypothetical protein
VITDAILTLFTTVAGWVVGFLPDFELPEVEAGSGVGQVLTLGGWLNWYAPLDVVLGIGAAMVPTSSPCMW